MVLVNKRRLWINFIFAGIDQTGGNLVVSSVQTESDGKVGVSKMRSTSKLCMRLTKSHMSATSQSIKSEPVSEMLDSSKRLLKHMALRLAKDADMTGIRRLWISITGTVRKSYSTFPLRCKLPTSIRGMKYFTRLRSAT